MPKLPISTLTWSVERNIYELHTPDHPPVQIVPGAEEQWFVWLTTHTSFSFRGQHGHLTVHKESRSRGTSYWYAYRSRGQRTFKQYLGRTATLARLEEIAQALTPEHALSLVTPAFKEATKLIQAPTPRLQEASLERGVSSSPSSAWRIEQLDPKLRLPHLPSSLIERPHLYSLLDASLARKFTLIAAPAGFGKTTLVRSWIASRVAANMVSDSTDQDQLSVAWVALDAVDNDPRNFWGTVLATCQTVFAQHETTTLDLVQIAQHQSMLTTFIQELSHLTTCCVLVLEDYHVITSPLIHDMLATLLTRLPHTLHVILTTRVDPPLPLARLRAYGEIQEIRAADLRFVLTETQAFLQQALPFPLDASASERMHVHTEGWVTGLRLLTLALQAYKSQQESEPLLASFSGNHRYILEYLVEEVLAAQSETFQLFLLQTSGLSRLTASLCDAVTGRDDSELLLEQVERANLFLQSLDGSQQWYRYHALWAQAMQREARRRLGATTTRALSAKASLWYEQQGLLPEAIEAALASEEFSRAVTLIERFLIPNSFNHLYHLLRGFLERLPKEVLYTRPGLCFAYAEAVYFTSARRNLSTKARLEEPLSRAEQGFRAQQNWSQLSQLLALDAVLTYYQRSNIAQAFALAHQALEVQPANELHWRGSSLILIALEEMRAGNFDISRQKILEALRVFEADAYLPGILVATLMLGEICAGQGELRQAAQHYQQVVARSKDEQENLFRQQLINETGARETLFEQLALDGLAQLSYEWNELEVAQRYLWGAPDDAQREELHYLTCGPLVQAHLLHARGLKTQAWDLLGTLVIQARSPLFLREVHACQARLQLADGDLSAVQRWSSRDEQAGDSMTHVLQEEEALLLARLYIVQGEGEKACAMLEPWKAEALALGRKRRTLEILLLEALGLFAQGHLLAATQLVNQVLTLAQPENYQRLFLDEGPALEALLKASLPALHETFVAIYARALLHAFAQEQGAENVFPMGTLLLEPLSPQEQRVLHLLVAGQTYNEIAQGLIVSPNTIKTQVSSIYRKLNVKRRAEAVAQAQQLHLF